MSTPPSKPSQDATESHVPAASAEEATSPPSPGGTAPQTGPSRAALSAGAAVEAPGYEVLGELGRGGMGVVYLARNVLMDRREVLKVVNRALLDKPGVMERFLREIRAAAMLNHNNVVKAYSAVQAGESIVFAMEYVDGEDLAKVVQRQGPLPIPYACHYVSQAALGLQHAHEHQMVHRDVKPQNLILSRQGKKHVVKVLDFGLAKAKREGEAVTDLTGVGAMMGTPAYMAPEQARDAASADIRADIYSLGCTLYFLLTGAPPFAGKSLFEILHAHVSTEAAPLQQVRAEAPAELAAVTAKMMAKDPARRFQKPIEAAQALAPFIKPASQPKSAQAWAPAAPSAPGPADQKKEEGPIAAAPLPARPDVAPQPSRTINVEPAPRPPEGKKGSGRPPATVRPGKQATMSEVAWTEVDGVLYGAPAKRPTRNKGDTTTAAPIKKGSAEAGRPRAKKRVNKGLMAASIVMVLLLAAGEIWLWNGGTLRGKNQPAVPVAEPASLKSTTPDKGSVPPPAPPRPAPLGGDRDPLPPIKPPANSPKPTKEEALAAIKAIGGSFYSDDNLDLANRDAKDSDLSYVRAFPKLRKLDLIGGNITDAGLAYLAETPMLEELSLNQDKVTGHGIQVLGSLPHLTRLYLNPKEGAFSASDFQVIGRCKELKYIHIGFTKLPTGSLRFLRDLPRLEDLDLPYAGVTDEHLDDVVACKTLEELNLQGAEITGDGLKKLGQSPRLSMLRLNAVETLSDGDKAAFAKDRPHVKIN